MKILHLIDSLGRGGAERLLVDVIKGLNHIEHHLVILNTPDDLKSELPANCRLVNLNRTSNFQLPEKAFQLRRYINRHKIDLVHSHLYFSNILARMATPASVPLFNSLHVVSSLDNYTKNRLSLWLDKLTYRKKHHVIAVSHAVMDDFDQWVGVKGSSNVLYNFIDDRYFQFRQKKELGRDLKLVAVGNLRYQKNYAYMMEAFKHLPANVSLDVYGEGPLRTELQAAIDAGNLRVTLKGSHASMHEVLPTYDAYVMCSFFEGQPLSLLEAIACGLPAFLSDIPVLREVTGENAVYFNLDDPQDFSRKIASVMEGKTDVLKMTAPAYDRINSFARKQVYFRNLQHLYAQSMLDVKLQPQAVSF
jgi:glycosyltransferase involved in cell wall biosynthesis